MSQSRPMSAAHISVLFMCSLKWPGTWQFYSVICRPRILAGAWTTPTSRRRRGCWPVALSISAIWKNVFSWRAGWSLGPAGGDRGPRGRPCAARGRTVFYREGNQWERFKMLKFMTPSTFGICAFFRWRCNYGGVHLFWFIHVIIFSPDADLEIADNRFVSTSHCVLVRGEGGWVSLNDTSTNGTLLNGTKLDKNTSVS